MVRKDTPEGDADHFNRRKGDVRFEALDIRMTALEKHVFHVLTPKIDRSAAAIDANTAITEESHGWVGEMKDELAARRQQTDEMYEVFEFAKNGVRIVGKIGNGIMWAAEKGGKLAKPLFWMALFFGAAWAYLRTGVWTWPKA